MFTLPPLSFAYDALEPYIDKETMMLHHTKHHQGYIDKLNAALEKSSEWQNKTIEELLVGADSLPEGLKTAVRNNGGGHANHSFFWQTLSSPDNISEPEFILKYKDEFREKSLSLFGSGWTWLVKSTDNELEVITTPNQDSPIMLGKVPVLGLDLWEHAYYLKYQNRRAEYVDAFWNVVNWPLVEKLHKTT